MSSTKTTATLPNRVDRSDDEHLYQPAIHSHHIRWLHKVSIATGTPITVLVDQALRELEERYQYNR